MGDSSGGEGPSNIKNLKTLITQTKDKFDSLFPQDKRWPCPFCSCKSQSIIKCRIHIKKEHANVYNANEEEFSQFLEEDSLYLFESDNLSFSNHETDDQSDGLKDLKEFLLLNEKDDRNTANKKKNELECDGCKKLFKSVRGRKIHSKKCILLSQQSSNNNQSSFSTNNPDENLRKCQFCPKNCKKFYQGIRGLKIHHGVKHKDKTFSENDYSTVDDCSTSTSKLEFDSAYFNRNVKVIKRIPKSARITAAYELARLIDVVVSRNNLTAWDDLLCFAYRAFQVPIRKSKSESLARLVKQNIKHLVDPSALKNNSSKKPDKSTLSARVEAKVSEGDVSGAVRLLMSTDTLAKDDAETLALLKEKHPSPSRSLCFPSEPDNNIHTMTTTGEDVFKAIFSFRNGSAGGIDGIRPQHLKDLVSDTNGDAAKKLNGSITKLTNLMLSGKVNENICKILYGARLVALSKKDKGIRPIAVGSTFRRLTAKIACRGVRDSVGTYLRPTQIGFSTKGGCEAAVHACRTYIRRNNGTSKVILKIDFKNAFNSVERDEMLQNIKERSPSIYAFMWQCYSSSSILFFGNDQINSEVGAQQGDPCGPLAFSLIIQPIIEHLASELNIWYLDDGTLGGDPNTVINDLKFIIQECSNIGLVINPEKCELFFCGQRNDSIIQNFANVSPGIKIVDDLELLGAPISKGSEEKLIIQKHSNLKVIFERMSQLNCHTAYYLLKTCFTVPKLTYIFRTSPCFNHKDLLRCIDGDVKETFESITNCKFNNEKWSLVSMPIRVGGMGVRKCEDIALPAYLSSVNSVINLVKLMLPNIEDETMIADYDDALEKWSMVSELIPENKLLQSSWDGLLLSTQIDSLTFHSNKDKARYLSSLRTESNAWLNVLPSKFVGTFLDNNTFRISTALRLGCDICVKHKCVCGDIVSPDGTHGLSCLKSLGRLPCHIELNTILQNALQSAAVPSKREPDGLFRDDGKRVDGMTLLPWSRGQMLVWDATCSDTLAPSYIHYSSSKSGSVAENASKKKHEKYKKLLEQNYIILAFAVETLGPWATEAINFIDKLGKMIYNATGEKNSKKYLKQRISLAIQRSNATRVMGTFNMSEPMKEIFYIL